MTSGRSRRRALQALAALTVAAATVAAAACSPLTTQKPYAPSDGVRAELGDELAVENLLVLTTAAGDPALVVGAVTNRSTERTTVTMTFGDPAETEPVETTVVVLGRSTVLLDPVNADGETLTLDASPAAPGATVPVTIATAVSGSATVQVPVLDGTLAPYDVYLEQLGEESAA